MGEEGPTDQKELVPRIGTFLILLGIFFFILFLASDFANLTDFDWLFLGLIFVAIGFFFRRRATPNCRYGCGCHQQSLRHRQGVLA